MTTTHASNKIPPMPDVTITRLILVREAAELSRIPYDTLFRLIKQQILRAVRLPGRRGYFIDPADLNDLIEASKTGKIQFAEPAEAAPLGPETGPISGPKVRGRKAKSGVSGGPRPYPSDWYYKK